MGFILWHLSGIAAWKFALFSLGTVVSGACIGSIGVGGVILMPLMLILLDADPHTGTASCMLAYFLPGILGSILYLRKGSLSPRKAVWISVGVVPAAGVATILVSEITGPALSFIIATVCVLSGIQTIVKIYLARRREQQALSSGAEGGAIVPPPKDGAAQNNTEPAVEGSEPKLSGPYQSPMQRMGIGRTEKTSPTDTAKPDTCSRSTFIDVVIGAFVGFGSTLTATSGPILLLPLYFIAYQQASATEAVGLANFVAIPISLCATIGFALSPTVNVDGGLAMSVTAGLCVGVPIGAHIAHKLPQRALKLIVAVVLVGVAISVITKGALLLEAGSGGGGSNSTAATNATHAAGGNLSSGVARLR